MPVVYLYDLFNGHGNCCIFLVFNQLSCTEMYGLLCGDNEGNFVYVHNVYLQSNISMSFYYFCW